MIRHIVAFKLKHERGSAEETIFLEAARKLSTIPAVQNFQCLEEIGKKNNFSFGLSMEFDSVKSYQQYNEHPTHVDFVESRWMSEVIDFIEIDFQL